jgi:hypothetical protein
LGTILAFAFRHKETKKALFMVWKGNQETPPGVEGKPRNPSLWCRRETKKPLYGVEGKPRNPSWCGRETKKPIFMV